jgi:pyruvate/2-oxoglutarate dehydrogenase complex dihydrolipoamide acyltransferase (E2) component
LDIAITLLRAINCHPSVACCTLTCDHRVVFGGDAARFLQTLGDVLAAPAQLLR